MYIYKLKDVDVSRVLPSSSNVIGVTCVKIWMGTWLDHLVLHCANHEVISLTHAQVL